MNVCMEKNEKIIIVKVMRMLSFDKSAELHTFILYNIIMMFTFFHFELLILKVLYIPKLIRYYRAQAS